MVKRLASLPCGQYHPSASCKCGATDHKATPHARLARKRNKQIGGRREWTRTTDLYHVKVAL